MDTGAQLAESRWRAVDHLGGKVQGNGLEKMLDLVVDHGRRLRVGALDDVQALQLVAQHACHKTTVLRTPSVFHGGCAAVRGNGFRNYGILDWRFLPKRVS